MSIVKWGIIGPGKIAHRFAEGLKESVSGELVAIASKTSERRKSFGDKYNIDSLLRFKNYEEIVDEACKAWNVFADQPNLIASIGERQWATL